MVVIRDALLSDISDTLVVLTIEKDKGEWFEEGRTE